MMSSRYGRAVHPLLTTEGYKVTGCGRGDEALDLIARKKFDLLLVDLFMSQVDGMEILAACPDRTPDSLTSS